MLDNDEMNFQIRDYTRKHLVEELQVIVGEAAAAMYLRSGPNEIAACRTSAPLPTTHPFRPSRCSSAANLPLTIHHHHQNQNYKTLIARQWTSTTSSPPSTARQTHPPRNPPPSTTNYSRASGSPSAPSPSSSHGRHP